jgi:CHAT domain-containing protein
MGGLISRNEPVDNYISKNTLAGKDRAEFAVTNDPENCPATIFVNLGILGREHNKNSSIEKCESEINKPGEKICQCESIIDIAKSRSQQEFDQYTFLLIKKYYQNDSKKIIKATNGTTLEEIVKAKLSSNITDENPIKNRKDIELAEIKKMLPKDDQSFEIISSSDQNTKLSNPLIKLETERIQALKNAFPELEFTNFLNYYPNYSGEIHLLLMNKPELEITVKESLFTNLNRSNPIPKYEQKYLLELAKIYLKNQNFLKLNVALNNLQESINKYGSSYEQIKLLNPFDLACTFSGGVLCKTPHIYIPPYVDIESEVHFLKGLMALQLDDPQAAIVHLKISKKINDYAASENSTFLMYENNNQLKKLITEYSNKEKLNLKSTDEFIDSFKDNSLLSNYRIAIPLSIALFKVGKKNESDKLLDLIKIYQLQIESDAPKKGIFYMNVKNSLATSLLELYLGRNDFKNALEIVKTFDSSFTSERTVSSVLSGTLGVLLFVAGKGGNTTLITQGIENTSRAIVTANLKVKDYPFKFLKMHLLLTQNEIIEAKKLLNELLADKDFSLIKSVYWQALNDAGQIAEIEKKYDDAENYYRQSINEIENQRNTISTELSRINFFGNKQKPYQDLIHLLINQNKNSKAFIASEQTKSRTLIDILSKKTYLEEIYLTDTTEKNNPILNKLSLSSINIDDIQNKLSSDTTLVSFHYDDNNLYAFLLNKSSVEVIPLERNHLEQDVQEYGQLIQSESNKILSVSEKLYKRLISPLQDRLKTPNLIIIKYGVLNYVPFAALKNNDEFLIDQFKINYLPTAALFTQMNQKLSAEHSLLALGNPNIGNKNYDLPFAEEEVKELGKILKPSKILVKENASKENLLKFGNEYKYIHIASHGKFNEQQPLESGLMLAGNSVDDPKDRLTAKELYSLKLNADLITLSACETGLGKVSNGDDVLGLVRGFMFAGAKNIVSTLWSIDDEATKKLMVSFYQKLNSGNSPAEALRSAQLLIKKDYPNPFYWGAFELTGSP